MQGIFTHILPCYVDYFIITFINIIQFNNFINCLFLFKILNPLLKVKALSVDEIMKEILTDIPNHSVQKSINSITLHKNIQGGIFKFRIELNRASDEEFFEVVTKSLCLSSMELFRRYSILLEFIKKKDEEIAEYKAEGAKLIRS